MKCSVTQTSSGLLALPESLREVSTFVAKEQGRWYDDEYTFVTEALCCNNTTVIEIHPEYGFYTTRFARMTDRVYCFEDDLTKAKYLNETLRLNNISNVVISSDSAPKSLSNIEIRDTNEILLRVGSEISLCDLNFKDVFSSIFPVVVVSVCHDGKYNFSIPEELFNKYKYSVYRYTPCGLVPFLFDGGDLMEIASTMYLTQLVAIPQSKITMFPSIASGMLLPEPVVTTSTSDLRVIKSVLYNKKWASGQQLLWSQQNYTSESYNKALAAYCKAEMMESGSEKIKAMHAVAALFQNIPDSQLGKNSCMLSTLARAYYNLGFRKVFVETLEIAIAMFDPVKVSQTPFVPCLPDFDNETATPPSTLPCLFEAMLRMGYVTRSRFSSIYCDQRLLSVFVDNLKNVVQTGYLVGDASKRLCVLTEASSQIGNALEIVKNRQQEHQNSPNENILIKINGLSWSDRIVFSNGVTTPGWYPGVSLDRFGITEQSLTGKSILIMGTGNGLFAVEAIKQNASRVTIVVIEEHSSRECVDLSVSYQYSLSCSDGKPACEFSVIYISEKELCCREFESCDIVVCDSILSEIRLVSQTHLLNIISDCCTSTAYISLITSPVAESGDDAKEELKTSSDSAVDFHSPTGAFRPSTPAVYLMTQRAGFVDVKHADVGCNITAFVCQKE